MFTWLIKFHHNLMNCEHSRIYSITRRCDYKSGCMCHEGVLYGKAIPWINKRSDNSIIQSVNIWSERSLASQSEWLTRFSTAWGKTQTDCKSCFRQHILKWLLFSLFNNNDAMILHYKDIIFILIIDMTFHKWNNEIIEMYPLHFWLQESIANCDETTACFKAVRNFYDSWNNVSIFCN